MVITKLQGGLGNQMFQYAAGRQLSLKHRTKLQLDLSFLKDKTPRKNFTIRDFELDAFELSSDCLVQNETKPFSGNSIYSKIYRKFLSRKSFTEKNYHTLSPAAILNRDIYLDGYWQSEKYFSSIRMELLSEFKLKNSYFEKFNSDNAQLEILNEIQNSNSVSVHFRRGDYVSNPLTNQFHGTCSVQYYQEAVNLICQRVYSPHFFLFSDDPEWVMNNRIIEEVPTTLVSTKDMHLDMYLMSRCRHNIIANSSYSWWGGWLNSNPEKIVIAPIRWFADKKMNEQTQDLVPQSWFRI